MRIGLQCDQACSWTRGRHMTSRALGIGMGCALAVLVAAGCSSSTTTSTPRKDGGGGDAALLADGSAVTSGDASGGVLEVRRDGSSPAQDAPASWLDSALVLDGGLAVDGGAITADGSLTSVDAGVDVPQVTPDAGLGCGQTGASCQTAADCCGLSCLAGLCGTAACLSDGTTCTSGGQCCSTQCGAGGTCSALNPSCKTAGNACLNDAECCNRTCDAKHQCASPGAVSYCAQTGDICRGDGECCTGVCAKAAGALAGTCASISTSCQIDGTVCNGCGSCCSHFCGPFGAGGPNICQPASGCHVQGDLCRKDSDCCGGDVSSGLPGAGLIKCEPDPVYGARIGTCGNPSANNCPSGSTTCKNACSPEGNVCHYKQTLVCGGDLTNVRNVCCDCISGKECCQPDATGIPRCNALAACVPSGGNCAFSGECCNQQPCLPDPVTGKLTCGSTCSPAGGACTTNGDCCTGMVCQATPGTLVGACTIPVPPPTPDAGVSVTPDAGASVGPDAGPSVDVPPICAYFGQGCSVAVPCCGSTCSNTDGLACTATDVNCICFSPE